MSDFKIGHLGTVEVSTDKGFLQIHREFTIRRYITRWTKRDIIDGSKKCIVYSDGKIRKVVKVKSAKMIGINNKYRIWLKGIELSCFANEKVWLTDK